MTRRDFVRLGLVAPAVAAGQTGPPVAERVEKLTAGQKPAIALNHLGFEPGAKKVLTYRLSGAAAPPELTLREVGGYPKPFLVRRPLTKVAADFGPVLIGDFSDITDRGMYQVTVGDERSVQFFIRPDVWRRTLPKAVSYHYAQRCGVEIPGVHPACHLDDARRRDNGQHVDLTGGWHDAGDLRKWMTATMMNGFGLLHLARNLGSDWDRGVNGIAPLLDEMRWGNRYFLKMQDSDGRIWADVAGGVNGDNSDNHWTDNEIGNGDDRYLNVSKDGLVQAMWIALQAMVAQAFRATDPGYAQACLAAGLRCYGANQPGASARELSWWTIAAVELYQATRTSGLGDAAVQLGRQLLALQQAAFAGGQRRVRGFWRATRDGRDPFSDAVYGAMPPIALLELAAALPEHADVGRWRDAVRLYLDEYVLPMTSLSPYRILPFGVFYGRPSPETYRPLAGELTYRYFLPTRKQFWWLGTSSVLMSHAALLGNAARALDKPEYRDLAFRQLEWIMGANPFGACLMSGEGMRNVYPHSRFVGLINGGIVNGIAGNADDEPILDTEYGGDWRTAEYWSPHNAFYLWAVSNLEKA
ncbi:MAG: glycoside hydrolase family 9 protein [Vicinamibacteraceae bacterium]